VQTKCLIYNVKSAIHLITTGLKSAPLGITLLLRLDSSGLLSTPGNLHVVGALYPVPWWFWEFVTHHKAQAIQVWVTTRVFIISATKIQKTLFHQSLNKLLFLICEVFLTRFHGFKMPNTWSPSAKCLRHSSDTFFTTLRLPVTQFCLKYPTPSSPLSITWSQMSPT